MKEVHILDGSSFIYRSYYALPPLKTKTGFPTGAIFGFLRSILQIIKSQNPSYFGVAFDLPAPTKRESLYKEYKANRRETPNDIILQIPIIKEFLDLFGIKRLEKEGYEADDIIACFSTLANENIFIKIYTPDKDMLQLVNDKVLVINPISGQVFDREKVKEKYGIYPEKLADYFALVGDSIDNIKGVKGVGPKKALQIIDKYQSTKNIIENFDNFSKEFKEANKEDLLMSYSLINLKKEKEECLEFSNIEMLRFTTKNIDINKIKSKLKELEINSLIKEVDDIFKPSSLQKTLF